LSFDEIFSLAGDMKGEWMGLVFHVYVLLQVLTWKYMCSITNTCHKPSINTVVLSLLEFE